MGEYASDDKKKTVVENQSRLRESIHKWLSPPDPSTNHNVVRASHHKGTADWFLQGDIYQGWKKGASLLWINGIPESGKSVLCSTIIDDIVSKYEAEQASMAYFYFDSGNPNKQHLRDLITSLISQLSAQSQARHDVLSLLYVDHDNNKTRPSDLDFVYCLKQMLFSLPARHPIYLVMDALDRCPDTSGTPSPRGPVLQLVKELVELHHPNLHICVTSRSEIDIRDVLEPLTSLRVSLHDQSGQKQDIVDYVKSVVYSDSTMKRWQPEDRELIVKVLPESSKGSFRFVSGLLQVIPRYPLSYVRQHLKMSTEPIEEYGRILKEIKGPNRDHAHRIFQCLVVAVRPLQVQELAEVLAVDFDDPEGIPKLMPSWRRDNEEQALLSSCSSLITIDDSRVVQFSHPSVKELVTSPQLAASSGDVSHHPIVLEHAHTILGQACLAVLLRSDDPLGNGIREPSPLTRYAAQHWLTHAQFESVSSYLRKPMQYLFDSDKPYFAAWLKSHDVDLRPESSSPFHDFCPHRKSSAAALYYAALCGFYDLAEHLIGKYPQQVNAHGGYYVTPLVAALAQKHFKVAELLLRHDATVNVRGDNEWIPLQVAAYYGQIDVVRLLLNHKADVNYQDDPGWTALHFVVDDSEVPKLPQNTAGIARLLLDHGADVNARHLYGNTPLHLAAWFGDVTVARVLLERDANVDEENNNGETPFHLALGRKQNEIMNLLSEYGAKSSR